MPHLASCSSHTSRKKTKTRPESKHPKRKCTGFDLTFSVLSGTLSPWFTIVSKVCTNPLSSSFGGRLSLASMDTSPSRGTEPASRCLATFYANSLQISCIDHLWSPQSVNDIIKSLKVAFSSFLSIFVYKVTYGHYKPGHADDDFIFSTLFCLP